MDNNDTQTTNPPQISPIPEVAVPTQPAVEPTEAATLVVVPKPKAKTSKKLVWALTALVVMTLSGVGAYAILSKSGVVKTNQPLSSSTATKSTTPVASSSTAAPASSADSAITSDLQSADTSLNQSSTDQSASDSALNDASQQITVPTN